MARREAKFSKELRSELDMVYGKNVFVQLLPDMRRTGKKPFDFLILYEGRFVAVECKLMHGHTFNVENSVSPHQPACLDRVNKCKGRGIFVVGFRKHKTFFILSPYRIDYLTEKFKTDSLKFDQLMDTIDESRIGRRKKIGDITRWEVERLVEC